MSSQPLTKRQERAHRILDAASDLILRWGYNKTAIDDIVKEAGVAKGTLYLHWKTREDLFLAVIKRERLAWAEDFVRRIGGDPAGATLSGMLKHSALALMSRPLLKAILLHDVDVLGKLAHTELSAESSLERLMGFKAYLAFLRQHGLVRTDQTLEEQTYLLSAIFMGCLMIKEWVPDDIAQPDARIAELIAEAGHRSIETDRVLSDDDLQTIFPAFTAYLTREVEITHQRFMESLE